MPKSMPKKYRKLKPKACQNDAKRETKIYEISYISKKGWNAQNYLFYNKKTWFRTGKKLSKTVTESMQNLGSKKACQKYGKWCQKGAQMGAQIHEKHQKGRKKGMPKMRPKNDAEKEVKWSGTAECAWPLLGLTGLTMPYQAYLDRA